MAMAIPSFPQHHVGVSPAALPNSSELSVFQTMVLAVVGKVSD
jgi:hypothetical protein